ncbi:histidinol-phosphate transaminase [Pseudoflavonifractor phocaeensis]|uniref:histidinol-phosphate transaminase n=1 Tax=Pseudoflavonifractor phocaeensis TaxID=1870988 RepID=UPI00313E1FAB
MKELWSQRCRGLIPYTPGEQPKGRKLIKLNTNENPYPPSPQALRAIKEAAGEGLRLYPDPECTELREGIALALDVKPEQIFVGNGSDEVLSLAFQAFFDPDKPIRFADITYSFYPVFADFYGLSYREIPLDEHFSLPLAPFLEPGGGVVLANPNAPTGRELDLCDIRSIVAANENSVVVVDEAYVDFGSRSAVELVSLFPNLLVVRTFSKGRSLAGLRVGYAVGDKDLIAGLNAVKNSFNSYPVDRLAQAGALGAIRDQDYFRATATKIISTRACTSGHLRSMGFTVCDSAANFLFVTHETVPAKVLLEGLRQRGILVRWWDKPRISNYLRITVGTDEDMQTLCQALREIIAEQA